MNTEASYAGRLKRELEETGDQSSFAQLIRPAVATVMTSTAPSAGRRQETSLPRGLGKKRGDGAVVERSSGVALTSPSANVMDVEREDPDYGVEWRRTLGTKDSGRIGGGNLLFRGGKKADDRTGSSPVANGATVAVPVATTVAATATPAQSSQVDIAKPVARFTSQDRKTARVLGIGGSTNGDRLGASINTLSADQQAPTRDNIIVKSRGKHKIVARAMHDAAVSGASQAKPSGKGKTRVTSSGVPGGTARGNQSVRGHHQRAGGTLEKSIAQVQNLHHASTGPGPRTHNSKVVKHSAAPASSNRSSSSHSNSSSGGGINTTLTAVSSSGSSSSGSNSSSSSGSTSSATHGANRIPLTTQRRTSGVSSSSNSTDGDGLERVMTDEGTEDSGSGCGKKKRRRRSGRSSTSAPICKAQLSDGTDHEVSERRSRRRLEGSSETSAASATTANGRLVLGASDAVGLDRVGLVVCSSSGGGGARIAGGLGSGVLVPAKKRSRTSARDSGGASGAGGSGSGNGVSVGKASSGRGGGGSGRGRGRGRGRRRGRRKGASLLESLAPRGPSNKSRNTLRWRTHRMVEDYVNTCGNIMYPQVTVGPFGYDPSEGRFPLERPSTLGMMRAEIRRPTVIEKWSPYQVALFEGAISIHGKVFHDVAREVEGKTVSDVIEFYYMWKKTAHYKQWKSMWRAEQMILRAHEEDSDSDDGEDGGEEEGDGGGRAGDTGGSGSSTSRDFERNQRAEARARKNGGPHGRGGS